MAKAKYLAWVDLETTGLDEHADPILEIGLVVTYAHPSFEEIGAYEAAIAPDVSRYPDWKQRMVPFVRSMHTKNGLLNDVGGIGAVSIATAEGQAIALLASIGRPHSFMLAGSGVGHFDRKFMDVQMPEFTSWLQHPCVDVGVLRRSFSFSGRSDLDAFGATFSSKGDKPHRGLADVRDHLNEFRRYAEIFSDIPAVSDGV